MKLKLTLFLNLACSGFLFAQQDQLNFTHQNINFAAPPRTTINSMSLKLWDNYNNGGPTSYGTVMEFYGLYGHQTGQLYFGGWDNSKIRYREAFYAQDTWSDWMTLLDSKNNVESTGKLMITGQGNHYINGGNVGIGTTTPNSTLTVRSATTGVSINPGGSPYYGTLAFNRESGTGAIFDPSGKAFQINNGGNDQNLHIQVYSGDGSMVTNNSLVISGTTGNVGIGTASLSERLSVEGKIRAREVKVEMTNWPDYVFAEGYNVETLAKLESYIKANKHLPGIPAAKEVTANGIELGEMNKKLLEKIEELTLHLIEKDKQLQNDSNLIKNQQLQIDELKKGYAEIKELLLKQKN